MGRAVEAGQGTAGDVGGSDNRRAAALWAPTVAGDSLRQVTSAPFSNPAPRRDRGEVTLRNLLAVPAFGLRLLAVPDAVGVVVRWAHPTELLDPRQYLSGGELVLTLGSSLVDDAERCSRFVDRLVESRVSALGYGVGDVTDEVPAALVAACRDRRLPLLEVPAGVPFQAITGMLADRRAEAMAATERQVQSLSTRLLEAIAADRPLVELLELVTSQLGGRVLYEDRELQWQPTSDADVPPSRSTLDHIGLVLAVRQHEEDVASAQRRAEAGRLLQLVLERKADPDALREALLENGVDPDGSITVAGWPEGAFPMLAGRWSPVLIADLSGCTLTLGGDEASLLAVAHETALSCGVAAPAGQPDLEAAVRTALAALDLSRRRQEPVTHRDLVSFEGLLEQQPPHVIGPFAEALLTPLAAHDFEHGTGLVMTLRSFLDADGSVNVAAQELHLHANSLRHRLRRIAELTGCDPRVFADRVSLAIGLWAWDRRPRGRR
jgi:purine catabolism regulator